MRAIDTDNGDFDDGLYSTVYALKLLTLAQAARPLKKKRKKKKKGKKKCTSKK